MSDKLPNLIDPLLFAERRSILEGTLKVAVFERLSDLVLVTDTDVRIKVQFAKEGKRAVVFGTIETMLELECQSCLQALSWPVDLSFKLGVVSSLQEADQLEIDCEPLLFDGEKVSLTALIEDELLLALPDYPKHGYDCIGQRSSKDADFDDQNQSETNNPFSVLAKLKKTGE
ncbi:MAG: YceD family protein [Methylomonas sp.]|nr:YceD family protein [Methylomonas sp.]